MNKADVIDFLIFFIPLVLFGWILVYLCYPKTESKLYELEIKTCQVKWINYPRIGDTCEILSEVYDIYGTEYAEIRSPFFRRSKLVKGFAHYDWPVDSIRCSKPMQDTLMPWWRKRLEETNYETLAVWDTTSFRKLPYSYEK